MDKKHPITLERVNRNKDNQALAAQKLAAMPGATLNSLLELVWGCDKIHQWCTTDAERLKLLNKGITNLMDNLEVARSAIRRLERENARIANKPELFPKSVL